MTHLANSCPICSSEVINSRITLTALRRDEAGKRLGGLHMHESWCPSCAIYLIRQTVGQEDTGWKTSFVEENSLTEHIRFEDLSDLLTRYELETEEEDLLEKLAALEKFLSMKKPQDEICRYIEKGEDTVIEGIVLKRQQYIIGRFVLSIKHA